MTFWKAKYPDEDLDAGCDLPAAVPVETVIAAAREALYTGNIGDGKIFVYDVEDAVKVRTGARGYDALQGTDD